GERGVEPGIVLVGHQQNFIFKALSSRSSPARRPSSAGWPPGPGSAGGWGSSCASSTWLPPSDNATFLPKTANPSLVTSTSRVPAGTRISAFLPPLSQRTVIFSPSTYTSGFGTFTSTTSVPFGVFSRNTPAADNPSRPIRSTPATMPPISHFRFEDG